MAAQIIYRLSELDSSQVTVAGGKGASLGELMQAGVPVPPGFVVSSVAFRDALRSGGHLPYLEDLLRRVDSNGLEVQRAATEIAKHLSSLQLSVELAAAIEQELGELGTERVSVRSSATCEDSGASAWAGQLETYLDVRPEDVLGRVRDCWLSMFSPPALAYGAAHGYGAGEFAVAVVVQHMVASEVSGIGFSVHPVTQEPDMMLVEACIGIGEAIVSGRIVPDQYVVERGSNAIVESVVGQQREGLFIDHEQAEAVWRELGESGGQRKLTDQQVVQYGEMLSSIQEHYGFPVDTEWAIENGEFQVLQARPITTLAAEYQQQLIDMSKPWVRGVRRPVSLVEASICAHWLDTPHAGKTLGFHVDRSVVVQDSARTAILYFDEGASANCLKHITELFHNDRQQIVEVLERGKALYRDTEDRIERGAEAFRDLDEAVDFFANVAQHTTGYPFWVLTVCEQEGIDDPLVRELAEELRARTLYPSIERRIIDPMVATITRDLGFSAPEEAPHVVTWSELRQGALDRDTLESRLEAVRSGGRFVFQALNGEDHVQFVSQTGYLIMRMEKQRQLVAESHEDQLVGQAAWPGVYRGRARVIVSPDAIGQTFEEGEVLVSIQSSPALMPFLQRCGAIVTDDGGIACHAAIIARELRKPTLIGTGQATSAIHTGDLVEVDAYAQVVRILERATENA